jgi:hypothetical protein
MILLAEVLLQIIAELLLQLFVEASIEAGTHAIRGRHKTRPIHPIMASIGYVILGSILGAVSLWLVPQSLIQHPFGRWLNLILTPVLVGICMVMLGRWREKRGQETIRLDRFGCAFLFALAMALVRFGGTA